MAPRQSRKTRADTSEAASDVETQLSSVDTMEADWMKTAQDMIVSVRAFCYVFIFKNADL